MKTLSKILMVLTSCFFAFPTVAISGADRPNIVLIMADDKSQ